MRQAARADAGGGGVVGERAELLGVPLGDVGPGQAARIAAARRRLGLIVLLLLALLLCAKLSGVSAAFHPEQLRETLLGAGVFSIPVFIAIFSVGELLHIPGIAFVGLAVRVRRHRRRHATAARRAPTPTPRAQVYAYGHVLGALVAYVGAICSLSVGFGAGRLLGGGMTIDDLGLPRWAILRAAFARLNDRPVRSVALMRMFLFMAPTLNFALALTPIAFRDYVLGSAIGLVVPLTPILAFIDIAVVK